MTTDQQCIIAQYATPEKLRTALEVLEKADYRPEQVTTVTSKQQLHENPEVNEAENRTPAAPADGSTLAASTMVGGAVGAALGAVTMVGPLLIAGALAGVAAGAAAGGLLNVVEGWGVEHDVSAEFEQAVLQGSSLVIVTGEETRLNKAERVLKTVGPEKISRYARAE